MNPRLLLLEDDPTSQQFLFDALSSLPANVDLAQTITETQRAIATKITYAAYVFDQNLIDGTGAQLIRALRQQGNATPALCLSADISNGIAQTLLDAGFDRVLAKPLSTADLLGTVGELIRAGNPAWNDSAGLRALGGAGSSLQKLRTLFLEDLQGQLAAIEKAMKVNDQAAVRGVLHRLKAACGFVGASHMQLLAERLSKTPDDVSVFDALQIAAKKLQTT